MDETTARTQLGQIRKRLARVEEEREVLIGLVVSFEKLIWILQDKADADYKAVLADVREAIGDLEVGDE